MYAKIKKLFAQIVRSKNKPKNITFELAKYEDVDFIMECIDVGVEEKHFIPIPRKEIENVVDPSKQNYISQIFVIKCNNKLIGITILIHHISFLGIKNDLNGEILYGMEINMLYIINQFRNQGIATSIINLCERLSVSYNIPDILVRCEQNNSKKAISLFEKLGYKNIGYNKQPKYNLTHVILKKTFS